MMLTLHFDIILLSFLLFITHIRLHFLPITITDISLRYMYFSSLSVTCLILKLSSLILSFSFFFYKICIVATKIYFAFTAINYFWYRNCVTKLNNDASVKRCKPALFILGVMNVTIQHPRTKLRLSIIITFYR